MMEFIKKLSAPLLGLTIIGGSTFLGFNSRFNNLENMIKEEGSPRSAYCARLELDEEWWPAPQLLFLPLQPGATWANNEFKRKYNLQALEYPEGCKQQ